MRKSTKKKLKRLFIVLGIIIFALVFVILNLLDAEESKEPADKYGQIGNVNVPTIEDVENKDEQPKLDLKVHTIDVGQGLSCLIDYGKTEILYDGGTTKSGKAVSAYIKPYVDGELDYVIASHPHEDHVGGLKQVYEDFQVNTTIYSGSVNTEAAGVINFLKAAKGEPNSSFKEDEDMTIDLGGGAAVNIIETYDEGETDNLNNLSVICHIVYQQVEILITGDAEKDAERLLRGEFDSLDLLVAGHHGGDTSNNYIREWHPKYFVISAGVNNDYGHPHKRPIEDAKDVGSDVYGTFKNGNIIFTTDGTYSDIEVSRDSILTLDDVGAKIS